MTVGELTLIDNAIQKYGDDFWTKSPVPNRRWIVAEFLDILAKADLDLKVVRKLPT